MVDPVLTSTHFQKTCCESIHNITPAQLDGLMPSEEHRRYFVRLLVWSDYNLSVRCTGSNMESYNCIDAARMLFELNKNFILFGSESFSGISSSLILL